jgi:hypothetical protein
MRRVKRKKQTKTSSRVSKSEQKATKLNDDKEKWNQPFDKAQEHENFC